MSKPLQSPRQQAFVYLGSEIRQLRKVRGITLQQLALATGKSVGFLSQVERNLTKPSVAAARVSIKDIALSRRLSVRSRPTSQTVTSIGGDTELPVTATRTGWPTFPMFSSKLAATSSMVLRTA